MKISKGYRVFVLAVLATSFTTCAFCQVPSAATAADQTAAAAAQVTATPAPAAPAAPTALSTPSVTGPISMLPPATFDAGPFGKISVNGILDGLGMWTGNYVPGDHANNAALGNGQVLIQKTDGWFQFYLQAGAYNIPALGTPFLSTEKTMSDLFGPVPVAFVKLQAGKNTSIEIGALPTLIGAEYTFTFENMNIEPRPVVEPGKRRQSRNPGQSDHGQVRRLI